MKFKYLFLVHLLTIPLSGALFLDLVRAGIEIVESIVKLEPVISAHQSQRQMAAVLEILAANSRLIESTVSSAEAQRIIDELSVEVNMQRVHEFKVAVDDINSRYSEDFEKLFVRNVTYERETMERFVNARDEFKRLRWSIRQHTVPTHVVAGVADDRLFEIMHGYLMREASNNRQCHLRMSHYKILYGAYNTAVLAVIKTTVMILHSYKYLQHGNRDLWKTELQDVQNDYLQTVANISEAARNVMARSSRAVTRCKPRVFIRGNNYINYLFRTLYITVPNVRSLAKNAYSDPWPRTGVFCEGDISNCIQRHVIKGCLAPPESGRRYTALIERGGFFDFTWYYKGPTIGDDKCVSDRMIADLMYYNNYACVCTEPSTLKHNAYLNKSAVYSDVANNRIITGIRLRTRWSITYLEIQEGELVNGTVLATGVRWRDDVTHRLEDYERRHYVLPDDFNLRRNAKYVAIPDHMINSEFQSDIVNLRNSDVKFYLHDILLPTGMVVTGVKFLESMSGGISLTIEGSEVFDQTGNFKFSHKRQWFSNDKYLRKPIILDYRDDPLISWKPNKEVSVPGESSVAFQLSGWNRDASQSVIPFIDLQEVVTDPPSPIGGVGIFYKEQKTHGGFISLKIFDIDNTIFMFNNRTGDELNFQWSNDTVESKTINEVA